MQTEETHLKGYRDRRRHSCWHVTIELCSQVQS